MRAIEPGNWVTVPAFVCNDDGHPEDVQVRLASHGEHFIVNVRRDRCTPIDPPPWVSRCASLYADSRDMGLIRRCEGTDEHAEFHFATDSAWDRPAVWETGDQYGVMEQ